MLREINGVLTYAIVYTLGMMAFILLALWLCHRREIPLRNGVLLGLCYIWSMNTGARILYDILNNRFDWINYFDPGYYMQPGMWGGPLVYLAIATAGILLLARDRRSMLDIVVLTLPVPMILAKVACFANGCCYGAVCSLPWAVTFPEGGTERTAPAGVALHPTQLYEILVLAVIAVVLVALGRGRWRGTLLAWFVMLYGIGRSLTEFFRAPEKLNAVIGPLTLSQAACLAAALIAGLALIVIRHLERDPSRYPTR
ncbi:MAG: prolipoprotein diacylglyceryl transferase [Candidatus Aminicenantes bacterium]|nr:prolipoprotein diacylglyceryl transferase [Candidatus Aminicenantes bacterium]